MATSAFGKAFSEARKAGMKTFEFNGKKYTTEMAEEKSSGPKAGVYVPRDSSARAGERATSENYVARDSSARAGERAMRENYVPRDGIGGGAGRGGQGGPTAEQARGAGAGRGGQGGPTAEELRSASAEEERAPTFKKGGAVRGWGKARGARAAKYY